MAFETLAPEEMGAVSGGLGCIHCAFLCACNDNHSGCINPLTVGNCQSPAGGQQYIEYNIPYLTCGIALSGACSNGTNNVVCGRLIWFTDLQNGGTPCDVPISPPIFQYTNGC